MRDHAVRVDEAARPATIAFAPVFNVAVPFIDRHIEEGRRRKAAIRTVEGDVSYGELAERVNRCSNALRDRGLAAGDRLLMVVKDCPEFFYLFWGSIKAGVMPVPVNTLLRAPDLQYMIDDAACAAVVYSPEYAIEVAAAIASARHRPQVFATDGETDAIGPRMARAAVEFDAVPTSEADDCFWLYSSGSTGRPKAAVHRHRDIVVTCVHYAANTLGIREDDVCFSAAKLFFAYGLGNGMTFPLWAGGTAVLSDQRPTPKMTFDLIDRFTPSLYFGVRRSTRRSFGNWSRRCGSCPHCGCAYRREKRCPRTSCGAGRRSRTSSFWTASGLRNSCTFLFPIVRTTTRRAPAAGWCRVTTPGFSTKAAFRQSRARRACCWSRAIRQLTATGTTRRNGADDARRLGEHGRHLQAGRRRVFRVLAGAATTC